MQGEAIFGILITTEDRGGLARFEKSREGSGRRLTDSGKTDEENHARER